MTALSISFYDLRIPETDGFVKRIIPINFCYKYFPNEADQLANCKNPVFKPGTAWGVNAIRFHIMTDFEIVDVRTKKRRATVKVLIKRLGWIERGPLTTVNCPRWRIGKDAQHNGDATLSSSKSKVSGRKQLPGSHEFFCRILYITDDYQEVTYNLARPAKLWRIISTIQPHISVGSAIKILECQLRGEVSGVTEELPSEGQVVQIKDDIRILEQHLKR